ncbi:MAG: CAP domain-containing protein [Deltaproteobacteria bacterium]|nr:CAP domain-containing protein [Deltaproteobacteria bacterium]MBW2133403.1 CAP domain-containing protein [Deltaproteobacteria bacterium]
MKYNRIFFVAMVFWIGNPVLSALTWAAEPMTETALGYYDPVEQTGQVVFFQDHVEADAFLESSAGFPQEVIRLVNQNRVAAGLFPLKPNGILNAMAQAHSDYMRATGCFAHQCAAEYSPAERICLSGYGMYGGTQSLSDCTLQGGGGGPGPGDGSCFIGEVIAAGYPNPASVVTGWMGSPPHYAILMHAQLREIGVGFASGGPHRAYWTLDAGSQPNVLPIFINDDHPETTTAQIILSLTNEQVSGFGGIDYAHKVLVSNDPGFAGAVWESYAPHKPWTLTEGTGHKTVYVKYRDTDGLEILSVDDILLR